MLRRLPLLLVGGMLALSELSLLVVTRRPQLPHVGAGGPSPMVTLFLLLIGGALLYAVWRVRTTGPYKLPRILPWRLSRRATVIWRERLFLGWCRGWTGASRFAFGRGEDSVAIVGPPRVGKTAGLLIPQAAMWDGALIQTSTKPDVLRATAGRRHQLARQHGGDVYVYAPTATGPIEGLRPIRWSPLTGCRDPRIAAMRVEALVSVAEVGKNVENADHWRAGAARILRGYFWAAAVHPQRPGDFALVRRWLSLHEIREPVEILHRLGSPGARQWADDLVGVGQRTNDKERSSFFAAAQTALKATAIPSVLESCSGTDIDPEEFIRTRSTLYIVAPSEHQAAVAPLIAALVESLVVSTYQLHGNGAAPARKPTLAALTDIAGRLLASEEPSAEERPARLLLQLDELTNIAPLPNLESIISQGAGQGVLTSWAVQSLAQLRNRYGDHAAEAIWSASRCRVIFGGLADGPALEAVSKLIGDHRVRTRSVNIGRDGQRQHTTSWEWRPRLSPAELRGLRPKWAVLLYHHQPPYALRAPVAARRWRMRRALVPWTATVPQPLPVPAVAAEPEQLAGVVPDVMPTAANEPTRAAAEEMTPRFRVVHEETADPPAGPDDGAEEPQGAPDAEAED